MSVETKRAMFGAALFLLGATVGIFSITVAPPEMPASQRDEELLMSIQAMLDQQTETIKDQRFREHVKDELKTRRRMTPIVDAIEEQWGSFGADWHREFGE